jgi:hypothetical protein
MKGRRFSKRMGLDNVVAAEITVRHGAPAGLRDFVVALAYDSGFSPKPLRRLVCRVLRVAPDPGNWSEWPNVAGEVSDLIGRCPWHNVYDIIEELYRKLSEVQYVVQSDDTANSAEYFETEINAYFMQNGIGWQLADGQVQIRGPEIFEEVTREAVDFLEITGRLTARNEIHQALVDLSRRPMPDLTGAVQHALAALECIARDVAGDPKGTLGDILKRYPDLLPRPLDAAVEKAWGYASEYGRHLREGREPMMEEAELLVGISGVVALYLAKKTGIG